MYTFSHRHVYEQRLVLGVYVCVFMYAWTYYHVSVCMSTLTNEENKKSKREKEKEVAPRAGGTMPDFIPCKAQQRQKQPLHTQHIL